MFKLLISIFRSPELVIADMGCGEAKISQSVPNKVFSFDFVAFNEFVTVCDMAKVVVYEIPACIFLLIILYVLNRNFSDNELAVRYHVVIFGHMHGIHLQSRNIFFISIQYDVS